MTYPVLHPPSQQEEDVGNLTSGSSAFSKTSLNIWKLTVHVMLKPGLEDFNKQQYGIFGIYSKVN